MKKSVLVAPILFIVSCGQFESDPRGQALIRPAGAFPDTGGVDPSAPDPGNSPATTDPPAGPANPNAGSVVCGDKTCETGEACDVATDTCVPVGIRPGDVCTGDSDCTPAICLPGSVRFCSYPRFSFTLKQEASVTCYSGTEGTFSRRFQAMANEPILSDMSANETSCVAAGLGLAGLCTQSTARHGTCDCSTTINPGSSTPTWNCAP